MSSTSSKLILGHASPIRPHVPLRFDTTITLSVIAWVIFEIPWIIGTYATFERAAAMFVAKAVFCAVAVLCLRNSRIGRYVFLFICFVSAVSIIFQFPSVYRNSYLFAALFSIEATLKLAACIIILTKYNRVPISLPTVS